MVKISAIKQQVKRTDRYSIFLDGKYTFSFSENELLKIGLRVNQEITEDELIALRNNAVADKAYDQALGQLSRRVRSEWELRDYLRRKEHPDEVIEITIERLTERGYVNDAVFAERWIENRRLLKSTSTRRLQQELRQKRVADDVIAQALESDDTDEHELLRRVVEKKRTQTKYQDEQKLIQYLLRQGYNYGDVRSVLSDQPE